MKKVLLSVIASFMVLSCVSCGDDADAYGGATKVSGSQENQFVDVNNKLGKGEELSVNGGWTIKFPEKTTNTKVENVHFSKALHSSESYIFSNYLKGDKNSTKEVKDIASINKGCEKSIKANLISIKELNLKNTKFDLVEGSRKTVKMGNFETLHTEGYFENTDGVMYKYICNYAIVNTDGVYAPLYLFGYSKIDDYYTVMGNIAVMFESLYKK